MTDDHPFEYQLAYHLRPDWTDLQRAEAYKALAERGTWSEGMWWHPTPDYCCGADDIDIDRAARRTAKHAGFRTIRHRAAEPAETA